MKTNTANILNALRIGHRLAREYFMEAIRQKQESLEAGHDLTSAQAVVLKAKDDHDTILREIRILEGEE